MFSYHNELSFKNQWFLTEHEAFAQSEILREKKLKSLKKQIDKIDTMEFQVKKI